MLLRASVELEVPRDRLSTFDPQLIAKYQRRFPGFDEKIVSMYARGMSVREIQGHLRDLYGVDVSADLVSPTFSTGGVSEIKSP
jgi:putative transposase